MKQTAFFNFFFSLTDFLAPSFKSTAVQYNYTGTPAIKDAIEAIGIPHTEVDIIVVNGSSTGFSYKLNNNDIVEVYPANSNSPFANSFSLIPKLNYPLRFVADVHVGKLVKTLRILGFDTVYKTNFLDKSIVEVAEKEQRIVLTRDIGLLKHKLIKWGYWLRSQLTEKQAEEVISRYKLSSQISLFTRCLACNGKIERVEKETVLGKVQLKTAEYFNEFFQCFSCKKIYWKGSHYENMLEMIKRNLPALDPQI